MAPGNSIDNGPAISQSRMDDPPRMIIEFGIPGAGRGGERGDVMVVVDAIRATTTIPLMLSRGAVKVIPCESRAAVEAQRIGAHLHAKLNDTQDRGGAGGAHGRPPTSAAARNPQTARRCGQLTPCSKSATVITSSV